jgi:hypothetical protein
MPALLQHLLFSIAVFGQLFAAIAFVFVHGDIRARCSFVSIADVGIVVATFGWLLGLHVCLLAACLRASQAATPQIISGRLSEAQDTKNKKAARQPQQRKRPSKQSFVFS